MTERREPPKTPSPEPVTLLNFSLPRARVWSEEERELYRKWLRKEGSDDKIPT
jgi:hypothetical protein